MKQESLLIRRDTSGCFTELEAYLHAVVLHRGSKPSVTLQALLSGVGLGFVSHTDAFWK